MVYNRTDGDLGKRLDGFTLTVLDADRKEVFRKEKNRGAARASVTLQVGGRTRQSTIRRAAMNALTTSAARKRTTFGALAKFVRDDVDRAAADPGPAAHSARRLAEGRGRSRCFDAVTRLRPQAPPADRTTPAALDALEFAEALAALLPADEAKAVRAS